MNITPDSFSDGNSLLNKEAFRRKWDELDRWAQIVDIGAESTAPMNRPISVAQELERYERFFLEHIYDLVPPKVLSIDTYKLEVFKSLAMRLARVWPETKLILNDISGQIDDELIELLKSDLKFTYIFGHNRAPSRDKSAEHMSHPVIGDVLDVVVSELQRIFDIGASREIWLDPCFGFSKNREQNQNLLRNFTKLAGHFKVPLVLGISRKSFLRNPVEMDPKLSNSQAFLTAMESHALLQILNSNISNEIILRTHGPEGLNAALFAQEILYASNKS